MITKWSQSHARKKMHWRERPYTPRIYGQQLQISMPRELEQLVLGKQFVYRIKPGGILELHPWDSAGSDFENVSGQPQRSIN